MEPHIPVLGMVVAIGVAAWWHAVTRLSPIDPWPTLLPLPPPLKGIFSPNTHLLRLQPLGEGLLPAPEDLTATQDGQVLYAACSDGWIKKVHLPSGTVHNWTKIDGRPLGLAVGLHGEILACEPSLGLLNVTDGNDVTILSNSVGGIKFKFADGVDVAKDDGSIYFTDASTKFGYGESDLDVLEGRPNGRLLKYDPSTRATSVLATNLYFPNGVAVSLDQSFLVFCETTKVRCQRLWLKGDHKGEIEIFIDNLPGYPDNIHSTKRGTFWIGLVSARSLWFETLLGFAFAKHFYATPKGLEALNVARYMAKVLEVSNQGEPIRYLEDPTGVSIGFVTTALEIGDSLYLGGLVSSYIGRLKLEV